jgi:hypothetical protein
MNCRHEPSVGWACSFGRDEFGCACRLQSARPDRCAVLPGLAGFDLRRARRQSAVIAAGRHLHPEPRTGDRLRAAGHHLETAKATVSCLDKRLEPGDEASLPIAAIPLRTWPSWLFQMPFLLITRP